jgi:predicted RNA binding protein YcfA (HicA-like mRNA interferase family)
MRDNPRGDWTIADVETVCKAYGITCKSPRRGSHHVLSHPDLTRNLTIPSHRPIKPPYIRQLVQMVEAVTR